MAPRSRILLPATLLLHVLVSTATAEPIVITGGSLLLTGPVEVGSVSISGTRGFSLQGPADSGEGGTFALTLCPCEPGMDIDLQGGFSDLMFQETRLTLDGQGFIIEGGFNSPVNLFMLTSGSVVLPSLEAGSAIDVSTLFSMEGMVALSPLAPRIPLLGNGLIHVFLDRNPFVPAWDIDAIRWDFQEPAPIPEPSSLLLVSAGAALLYRCRHQPRRR